MAVEGNIATVDAAAEPHEHYHKLKEIASGVEYYRSNFSRNTSRKRTRRLESDYHRSDVTDHNILRQTFDDIARAYIALKSMTLCKQYTYSNDIQIASQPQQYALINFTYN